MVRFCLAGQQAQQRVGHGVREGKRQEVKANLALEVAQLSLQASVSSLPFPRETAPQLQAGFSLKLFCLRTLGTRRWLTPVETSPFLSDSSGT